MLAWLQPVICCLVKDKDLFFAWPCLAFLYGVTASVSPLLFGLFGSDANLRCLAVGGVWLDRAWWSFQFGPPQRRAPTRGSAWWLTLC